MDYNDRYDDEYEDDDRDDRNRDREYGDYDQDYDEDYDEYAPYANPNAPYSYDQDDREDDRSARFNILRRYPRAPLWRRGAALAIDGILVGIPSSLGSPGFQFVGFALLWAILRIVVVAKNQGQSLGRWALDMRVIDGEFGRTPELLPLVQRETVLGIATFLTLEAIGHLGGLNAWVIMGLIPLGLDATIAFTDEIGRQTFHDRWSQTYVVQSRRGYSLDLRLKRLLASSNRPPMR
jgi:uncharacterized RDD family membrane protein YckC